VHVNILLSLYTDHCKNINLYFAVLSYMLWSYIVFKTSSLDGVQWPASCPGCSTPWEIVLSEYEGVRHQSLSGCFQEEKGVIPKLGVEPAIYGNLSHSLVCTLTELACY
jgi:hypothetical protein